MDHERRLELIALLARQHDWDAIVLIGRELLEAYWPGDIFTGTSGDAGPQYTVALRAALNRLTEKE